MVLLLHLNGPPGIGKSTLARLYIEDHPGTLNCDIDVLRTLIGGWATDFERAGELIRPAALAMIEAYLASGSDVVLPQLLTNPEVLANFEACAARSGARFVERVLMDDVEGAVARFGRRGERERNDPWHDQVRAIVAANGGESQLIEYHAALVGFVDQHPGAVAVASRDGDAGGTYESLLSSLQRLEP